MRIFVLLFLSLFIVVQMDAKPLSVPAYDPFRQTQKILKTTPVVHNVVHKRKTYALYAIYDDKVNINGKFFRLGQKIDRYCSLLKIEEDRVLLKCQKNIKTVEFFTKKTYTRVGK